MLTLYDHPLSPYAQTVKIALREKGQAFAAVSPGGLGAGGAAVTQARTLEKARGRRVVALPEGDQGVKVVPLSLEVRMRKA